MRGPSVISQETILDFVLFKLTTTRTRCEVFVCVNEVSEKLTTGLVKPFVTHIRLAQEQVENGSHIIRLEPSMGFRSRGGSGYDKSYMWFTKGTVERAVRFVTFPQLLERIIAIDTEVLQLDDALRQEFEDGYSDLVKVFQRVNENASDVFDGQPMSPSNGGPYSSRSRPGSPSRNTGRNRSRGSMSPRREYAEDAGELARRCRRALEERKGMLKREQGVAFARAQSAGFTAMYIPDLVAFAECFGASRMREACLKFSSLLNQKGDNLGDVPRHISHPPEDEPPPMPPPEPEEEDEFNPKESNYDINSLGAMVSQSLLTQLRGDASRVTRYDGVQSEDGRIASNRRPWLYANRDPYADSETSSVYDREETLSRYASANDLVVMEEAGGSGNVSSGIANTRANEFEGESGFRGGLNGSGSFYGAPEGNPGMENGFMEGAGNHSRTSSYLDYESLKGAYGDAPPGAGFNGGFFPRRSQSTGGSGPMYYPPGGSPEMYGYAERDYGGYGMQPSGRRLSDSAAYRSQSPSRVPGGYGSGAGNGAGYTGGPQSPGLRQGAPSPVLDYRRRQSPTRQRHRNSVMVNGVEYIPATGNGALNGEIEIPAGVLSSSPSQPVPLASTASVQSPNDGKYKSFIAAAESAGTMVEDKSGTDGTSATAALEVKHTELEKPAPIAVKIQPELQEGSNVGAGSRELEPVVPESPRNVETEDDESEVERYGSEKERPRRQMSRRKGALVGKKAYRRVVVIKKVEYVPEGSTPRSQSPHPQAEANQKLPETDQKLSGGTLEVPESEQKVPIKAEKLPEIEQKQLVIEQELPEGQQNVPEIEQKQPEIDQKVAESVPERKQEVVTEDDLFMLGISATQSAASNDKANVAPAVVPISDVNAGTLEDEVMNMIVQSAGKEGRKDEKENKTKAPLVNSAAEDDMIMELSHSRPVEFSGSPNGGFVPESEMMFTMAAEKVPEAPEPKKVFETVVWEPDFLASEASKDSPKPPTTVQLDVLEEEAIKDKALYNQKIARIDPEEEEDLIIQDRAVAQAVARLEVVLQSEKRVQSPPVTKSTAVPESQDEFAVERRYERGTRTVPAFEREEYYPPAVIDTEPTEKDKKVQHGTDSARKVQFDAEEEANVEEDEEVQVVEVRRQSKTVPSPRVPPRIRPTLTAPTSPAGVAGRKVQPASPGRARNVPESPVRNRLPRPTGAAAPTVSSRASASSARLSAASAKVKTPSSEAIVNVAQQRAQERLRQKKQEEARRQEEQKKKQEESHKQRLERIASRIEGFESHGHKSGSTTPTGSASGTLSARKYSLGSPKRPASPLVSPAVRTAPGSPSRRSVNSSASSSSLSRSMPNTAGVSSRLYAPTVASLSRSATVAAEKAKSGTASMVSNTPRLAVRRATDPGPVARSMSDSAKRPAFRRTLV